MYFIEYFLYIHYDLTICPKQESVIESVIKSVTKGVIKGVTKGVIKSVLKGVSTC